MAWTGERKADLPPDWEQRRRAVKARANGMCEKCGARGTDCHHAGDRMDHRIESLQWVCRDCHNAETQAQARAAQRRIAAKGKHPMYRR